MSRIVSVNMDYNHADHSTGEHDGSEHSDRDMDIMHDFGEGVGVDMRDFTNHIEGEEVETDGPLEALAALEKDVNVHLTPTQNHLGPAIQQVLTPRMSHSLTPTGIDTTPIQHGSSAEPSSSGVDMNDIFKTETGLDDDDDEDELDGESQAGPELTPDVEQTPQSKRPRHNDVPGGFTFVDKDGESGRRKIRIEYISDKSRRHITFSKRKAGIMKKAYELSILTGTQVLLLVVSETGLVYTFTTTKLQPLVQKAEGKNLIQACLNAPDGLGPDGQPLGGPVNPTKSKNGGLAIRPHKLTAKASAALAASAQAASMGQTSGEESTQQSDAAAAVGQGTPTSARPKKRLPSGKGKKAQATAIGTGEIGSSELVPPPVPTIPDMHRQSSPAHMMPQQQQLTSPMSAGYHIPTEYHHQHHQHQPSPTQPTFGYTGGQPGAQEYQGGYYGGPPAGHPGHTAQHPTYLNVQQQHIQYQVDSRERARMMMEQNRAMEMGI